MRRILSDRRLIGSLAQSWCSATIFFVFYFLGDFVEKSRGKILPGIYWNSTNEIFRIDNTDHVFVVKLGDRIDFICPYSIQRATLPFSDVEVLKIHSVSQWAYDYCALSSDSIVVGVCNNPLRRTFATVVFREYTPKPGGLEFKSGKSYYFISTSTGHSSGIENKYGGLCLSRNMKVKFEIEPGASNPHAASFPGDDKAAADGSNVFSISGDRISPPFGEMDKLHHHGQDQSKFDDRAAPVLYQINANGKNDGRMSDSRGRSGLESHIASQSRLITASYFFAVAYVIYMWLFSRILP